MKVVAFNGSPRRNGNTVRLIQYAFKRLEEAGIECELIHITGNISRGCTACSQCRKNLDMQCVIKDDQVNAYIKKMVDADGIILGSPTYFAGLTSELKALIDRAGYVLRGNGNLLKRKIGGSAIAVRRAGSLNVFNYINAFFLINEMIVPGSNYWNVGFGRGEGDVENDEEGIITMEKLGENMAWLMGKVNS